MKTALITGITGQDGTYLAELLAGKGYRVVGTTRAIGTAPAPTAHAELRQLSFLDADEVVKLVQELEPDEVYHLAGQSSVGQSFVEPLGTFRSIADSTLQVLEAVRAARAKPRLVIASSGEVFGDTGGAPATETSKFDPQSPYAVAKAAAASLGKVYRAAYGLFVCVAFLYNHESPRRPVRFVTRKIVRGATAIRAGRAERLELGDLSVVRDWGWAPEYVDALFRMPKLDVPDDFVIATGESHPLERFARLAFERLGLRFEDHVTTRSDLLRPVDVPIMRANPTHAAQRLGWRATLGLEDVVTRLLEGERDGKNEPA